MPLKNGNTVAVERRVDLASLFCMIARHGPAVALVVLAMVSVLGGFILYRTMRGKRRKAAAADGACESSGAETAAPVIQQSLEESVESTDVSDEVSSDVMEDDDVIQSDLNIRHRRTAAAAATETKPPPYAPPISDIQAAEIEHTTADETEEITVVWHSYKASEMSAEETDRDLLTDAYPMDEMTEEDDVDCHQRVTDDIADDLTEEVHDDDSCFEEPDLITDEKVKEVFKAGFTEDEDLTTDKDVSDNGTRQEENFQCALDNPLSFEQNLLKDKTSDDERILDSEITLKTNSKFNLEDSVSNVESTPTISVCYCKDEGLENQNSADYQSYADNDQLPLDAEEHEDEKAVEKAELAETRSTPSDQDRNLLSTQQDQFECVTDKEMLHPKNSDMEEDDGLAGKATEGLDEDCLSTIATTETKADNVFSNGTMQVKEGIMNTDKCVECDAERDSLGTAIKADDHNIIDFSDKADLACLSSDCQPQGQDQVYSSLNDDSDFSILGLQTPSTETEKPESLDQVHVSQDHSCFGDQQSDPPVNNEDLGEASVALHLDTTENVTASAVIEDISGPQPQTICQDQQTDHTENDTFAEKGVDSAPDVLEKEDEVTSPLNDDNEFTILGHQMSTHETEKPGNISDGTAVMPDEYLDQVHVSQDRSCFRDHQSDSPLENEELGETRVALDLDTPENVMASVLVEEIACPQLLSIYQDQQPEHMENEKLVDSKTDVLEEDKVASFLSDDTETHQTKRLPENASGGTIAFPDTCLDQGYVPEERSCPQLLSICQDQASGLKHEEPTGTNTDSFTNAVTCDDAAPTTVSVLEKASHSQNLPPSQDQENGNMKNSEPLEETRPNSVVAHDDENITAPPVSEEISHPDVSSFSQDHSDDSMKNTERLSEDATDPVMCENISWSVRQMNLPPFEQSEQKDVDVSSPDVGAESGISSMAVSPDLQDAGNELDMSGGNTALPVIDCDLQSKVQSEAQCGVPTVSVITEDGAFMEPTSDSSSALRSQDRDLAVCESFGANEDIFGHEIEIGYHKAMDKFTVQITSDAKHDNDNLKIQTDMTAATEIVQSKEKESAKKKVEAKVEKEQEEEYEKTEISIMEATMDNNEWITESNYQVPPWLNFTAPSFAPEPIKTNQISTEECQYSTAGTDTTYEDTTSFTQFKQPSALPLVEENMESNKKVVAVQPMPQNVNVTFRVHYFTQSPFQTVAVTGDQQELGNWKGFIPLERAKDGHWVTVVSLPAESHVQWKFVVLEQGEVCRWEECGNRLLDTGYGDDLLVHKWWGLM